MASSSATTPSRAVSLDSFIARTPSSGHSLGYFIQKRRNYSWTISRRLLLQLRVGALSAPHFSSCLRTPEAWNSSLYEGVGLCTVSSMYTPLTQSVDGYLYPSALHRRNSLSTKTQAIGNLLTSQEEPLNVVQEEEENYGSFFGAGIRKDLKRRLVHYASDFKDGLHPKAVAAIFFLYFACLAPCIAFGGLLSHVTAGHIGVVETIIGTAGAGVLYPLAAGQPLTLLGPTGLMVVFCGLLYKVTLQMGLPFLPVYGWVGMWSGFFLVILAAVEASNLICHFTRFTDETFSALISLGYISEALKGVGNMFKTNSYTLASSLLAVILAGGTWQIASILTELKNTRFLFRSIRSALSDFGPPLAIFVMSSASHLLFPSVSLPELSIPSTLSTTSGRPWQIPLFSIPPWAIVASAIPAALLTLLVFLDQNITTRLVNNVDYHLRKGAGYHLDLAVLGVLMAILSCFGLPWMFASTVPSLSHVRSLATTSQSIHISGDNAEAPEEGIVGVRENRVTGILIHVCIGASLLLLSLLRLVPMPVIDGIFLYMGVTSLAGNQFIERLKLWFCDPELYPQHEFIESVPKGVLHSFTALQLGCVAALWALKHSPYGITFPLLILALMPIRNHIAGSFVSPPYLEILDAH
ncbi:hypothetical protein KP509_16G031700 [Ceratopteris richardii]|uniref:Bicarbonate transporter-like transmembrane domain-containing protein n=1 Tax=Ceratopteris richardii TaxID=49495 RepID=A0A8T2SXP4_CERRI|nr:hypothetical protein KP509_16G031700 [Ceratopteris richardii]